MAVKITVKIKGKNKSLTRNKTVYNSVEADFTDSNIDSFVAQSKKEYGDDPGKVTVDLRLIEE